ASQFVQCLSDAAYFESVSFTTDDIRRKAQYAANEQRDALQVVTGSVAEYLASLQMTMQTRAFDAVDLPRIAQLTNKTNQFNTTTRRRTLEEIRHIASAPDILTLQVRLSDRFGDNGLVSAVIMKPSGAAEDTYDIDSWVMSCRVFGRQLEHAILNTLVTIATEANAKFLIATYKPTPKNMVIKNLFAELGFELLIEKKSAPSNETHWRLDLKQYCDHTTQIDSKG
ncbi:MAG: methoxymalonyl-ACP biosynthesis protein FkbH, partial [Gammaproteobacteria bacterium]|nr:methoxymalonyl-ACP biosynthesis protein FkbH [Gammaproteobacteria bacterium]